MRMPVTSILLEPKFSKENDPEKWAAEMEYIEVLREHLEAMQYTKVTHQRELDAHKAYLKKLNEIENPGAFK